jgi:hypothetical protein
LDRKDYKKCILPLAMNWTMKAKNKTRITAAEIKYENNKIHLEGL